MSASETRERILDAATALFYAQGIRATSADRIIEQVGLTKVTFYRHFRTKTDLVVAYLERLAAGERAAIEPLAADVDPGSAVASIADLIGTATCAPGFRGCPFINAAAEVADAADPVRVVVAAHRDWLRSTYVGLAERAGVADPVATGGQLMMLRDGAMVAGYLGEPEVIGAELAAACRAVLS